MTLPRDQCDAGYLCYSGAVTSNPIDGVTGELCTRGSFCPIGRFIFSAFIVTVKLFFFFFHIYSFKDIHKHI